MPYRSWAIASAIVIVFGLFFRFDRLDGKLFTNDEVTTSIHVSGHTLAQYDAAVRGGRIVRVADLAPFAHVGSVANASMRDVASGLALEDPQHPPLFYLAERAWQTLFGNAIAARRALAALFGALAIFGAFAFGRALVAEGPFAFVLAALVAVSPFHVLYAQQAREYGLWTLAIFIASALLLRALATSSPWSWAQYAIAVTGGLYTDVLFVYTLAAHALYVAIAYRHEMRRAIVPFALAAGAAVVAFAPWLVALVRGRAAVTNNVYLGAALPLKIFALKWLFNAGAVFYDLDYERHATVVLLVPIFGVVLAGAIALRRSARRRAALFVALLGAVPGLAMLAADVVRHESRSTAARYLIPLWIACECAAAYGLCAWSQSPRANLRRGAAAAAGGLALAGLASLVVSAQREYWWGDAGIAPIGPIARAIAATSLPVTIVFFRTGAGSDLGPLLLADAVDPRVALAYVDSAPVHVAATGTTYVLDPPPDALASLARAGWRADLVYRPTTADAALADLRRDAARSRGSTETNASLWRLR